MTLKFDGLPWKAIGHLYITSSFVHHFKAMGEFKLESQSGNAQLGSKSEIFCPVWPWNLSDDLEQAKSEGFDSCNRPGYLTQIGLKLLIFQPVTLKFDGWPRKIIGHLFYTTSNFVHHFKSISEFKLELQSGNTQFRSKSAIFLSRVTLKFDIWPWKTKGTFSMLFQAFCIIS